MTGFEPHAKFFFFFNRVGDPPSISPHSKPDSPFLIQLEMASKTKLETLLRWFEDNEIEWDKETLELRDTNNSLGVFAKQDIEEGCPGECSGIAVSMILTV